MDDIKQRTELGEKKMNNWLSQDQHEDEVRYEISSFIEEEHRFVRDSDSFLSMKIINSVEEIKVMLLIPKMESELISQSDEVKYAVKILYTQTLEPYQIRLTEFQDELNSRVNLSNTSET
jgi:hypothetical protein